MKISPYIKNGFDNPYSQKDYEEEFPWYYNETKNVLNEINNGDYAHAGVLIVYLKYFRSVCAYSVVANIHHALVKLSLVPAFSCKDVQKVHIDLAGPLGIDLPMIISQIAGAYREMNGLEEEENKYLDEFKDECNRAINKLKYQGVLDVEIMAKQRGLISDAFTSEEMSMLRKAYRQPQNAKFKDSIKINEMASENIRFRSELSRKHGNVVGKELDKVIDDASDEEIMDILSSGDSYGQDYAQYIKENPEKKSEIIQNIKNAMKRVEVGLDRIVITGSPKRYK